MTDGYKAKRVIRLKVWAWLRERLGLPVYYHQQCDVHRFRWHRVSFPAEGPLLILCPRGAYRIEPAFWGKPHVDRLFFGEPGPASFRDTTGEIQW